MADERQATRARMRVAGPENPPVRAGTEDERGVRRPGDGGGTRRERDRDIASRGLTSQNRSAMAMGEIRTRVTLENSYDREMVDRGAVTLVIPKEVANELGLRRRGTRTVVYADERRDQRPVGRGVTIEIGSLHHRERVHDRTGGQRGADRPSSTGGAGPDRRQHEPDSHTTASRRTSAGPPTSGVSSDDRRHSGFASGGIRAWSNPPRGTCKR